MWWRRNERVVAQKRSEVDSGEFETLNWALIWGWQPLQSKAILQRHSKMTELAKLVAPALMLLHGSNAVNAPVVHSKNLFGYELPDNSHFDGASIFNEFTTIDRFYDPGQRPRNPE